jgi:hypothetical protein
MERESGCIYIEGEDVIQVHVGASTQMGPRLGVEPGAALFKSQARVWSMEPCSKLMLQGGRARRRCGLEQGWDMQGGGASHIDAADGDRPGRLRLVPPLI